MKNILSVGAALLLTTTVATAGGLDRSGQPITVIFEDGNYAELSFGMVMPEITGAAGPAQSGNIANDYNQFGFATKSQFTDQLSVSVIMDQPFGADVQYSTAGYPLTDTEASVASTGITGVARYEIDPVYSVHAGVRHVIAEGIYDAVVGGTPVYASNYSSGGGTGYVVGGAYERDEIALRVALTYSSEVDLALDGTVGDLTTTLPESVNLDFQSGIAADTLLFGSVRWVGWDGFALTDSLAGDILTYSANVTTYNIGVGRRITDSFAGSVSVGYEASTGEITGNLGPTDGYISLQVGGAYTLDSGVELSGGVRYVDIGDATTSIGAVFEDNSAIAVGMKVAYNF